MPRFSARFWPSSQGHRPCLQRPCDFNKGLRGVLLQLRECQVADSWTEGDGACNLQTRTASPSLHTVVLCSPEIKAGWSRRSRTTCPAWSSSSFKHHSRRQTATSQARIRLSSRFRHLLPHVADATRQAVPGLLGVKQKWRCCIAVM